ncbi:SAM-dependent methyltransferase [Marilutibacter alkalisoli]|nr:methyltransferase domain-containing protein [Lysobacter alkalisoli]
MLAIAMAAVLAISCSAGPPAAPSADDAPATAGEPRSAPADEDPLDLPPVDAVYDLISLAPEDSPRPARTPDVVYVPTPQEVVDAMLEIADVGPGDVVYDLGSGDGRIPITAAQRWGTRGVGIELHPLLVREANLAAHREGVDDKVTFIEGDMFELDLTSATVVTLYLLPDLNLRLRPKLLRLAPGTRIVTHNYHMGDWVPQRQRIIGDSVVYYWTVPEEIPAHLR